MCVVFIRWLLLACFVCALVVAFKHFPNFISSRNHQEFHVNYFVSIQLFPPLFTTLLRCVVHLYSFTPTHKPYRDERAHTCTHIRIHMHCTRMKFAIVRVQCSTCLMNDVHGRNIDRQHIHTQTHTETLSQSAVVIFLVFTYQTCVWCVRVCECQAMVLKFALIRGRASSQFIFSCVFCHIIFLKI